MPLCSASVAEWSEGWSMGRPGESVPAMVVLRQRCTWRVWGLSRKPVWGEQSDQERKWYSRGAKGAHTMQGTAGHFKDLGFFFQNDSYWMVWGRRVTWSGLCFGGFVCLFWPHRKACGFNPPTRDWTQPWQCKCRVLTTGLPGNSLSGNFYTGTAHFIVLCFIVLRR